MAKKTFRELFYPFLEKFSWVIFFIYIIISSLLIFIIRRPSSNRFIHYFLFGIALWWIMPILIVGGMTYLFWKKTKVPRKAKGGVSLLIGGVGLLLLIFLMWIIEYFDRSAPLLSKKIFISFGYWNLLIGETLLIALFLTFFLTLLLKLITQGNWKTVIFLALKICGVIIILYIISSSLAMAIVG